jgi:hypothetical protein
LCGNSEELLYIDKETGNGTCYRKNTQGPCGDKALIVADLRNSSLGICDCDFNNNERILVFHPETNQCYFVFTQVSLNGDERMLYDFQNSYYKIGLASSISDKNPLEKSYMPAV